MFPTKDPLARPLSGAEENALKDIFRYRRALKELKSHQLRRGGDDEDAQVPHRDRQKDRRNSKKKEGGDGK
jgi:hypothetical protein